MTTQISDTIVYRGCSYDLVGVEGTGFFDPRDYCLDLEAFDAMCNRGYLARYKICGGRIRLDMLKLSCEDTSLFPDPLFGARLIPHQACYREGKEPIMFTGGLLAASGLIIDCEMPEGSHPAMNYTTVYELLFDLGKLTKAFDRSAEMAELRAAAEAKQEGRSETSTPADYDGCFDRVYRGAF